MALIPDKFTHVWVVDFEYQARDGEQQVPVAMVAKGFKKARDIRMFFDKPQPCPFTSDPDTTLFIGFNISSEYKCFLALGWQLPKHTIDLYVEYRNLTCGVWRGKQSLWELGTGLVQVVKEYEGNPPDFWKSDKHMMQKYISHYGVNPPAGSVETVRDEDGAEIFRDFDGEVHVLDRANPEHVQWYCAGRTPEEHAKMILDYCEEDVVATHFVARHIMNEPAFNFEQALHRGSYTHAVAHFEHNGLPINKERFEAIKANARKLQLHIVREIERVHNYGVYVIEGREDLKNKPHPVFKTDKFVEMLERNGIAVGKTWQTTPTGLPVLEDDYFGEMCNAYPFLQPLRQCRKTLKALSLFDTVIGEDGFQRFTLFMFGSVTSRNNPRATEFMLSRPHWMRNLLTPRSGYALVTADITGAEDWLAAGYSGDPELMRIYSGGADKLPAGRQTERCAVVVADNVYSNTPVV
jgi:DNA polymerase-1